METVVVYPYNVHMLCAQLCLTLCDPLDCRPPGSSVHGIFQARLGVGYHFLLQGIFPTQVSCVSCISGGLFTCWTIREAHSYNGILKQLSFHATTWMTLKDIMLRKKQVRHKRIQRIHTVLFHLQEIDEVSQSVSSVTQSCSTLCHPMDCTTPGLPVHHQLPELTQTHVHWVGDAIQPSHPLSSPSLAFNPSQHQGLFKCVSSLHQVAKAL